MDRIHEKIFRCKFAPSLGGSSCISIRILHRLHNLRNKVPPRVMAAYFSSLWNRWTTTRRFQQPVAPCLLGCHSATGEDSLEHYLRCPIALEVARRRLRLALTPSTSWTHFLLAAKDTGTCHPSTWWVRCILIIYATYVTVNAAKHTRPLHSAAASRALRQALYEAAKGHASATRTIDTVFSG